MNNKYEEELDTIICAFDKCGYEDICEYADVMTLKDFIEAVNDGCFIDYDGYGELIIDNKIVSESCTYISSNVFVVDNLELEFDKIFIYFGDRAKVAWYNK